MTRTPWLGSPKNSVPSLAGGKVFTVKETTVPSGSVPPSPGMFTVVSTNKATLELLATGGPSVGGNSPRREAVAGAGLMAPRLSVAL